MLLVPGACLLLEVGMGQAATVAAEAAALTELEPARLVADYAGIDRVVVLRRR
jgi:hypothetical protein